MSFIRSFSPRTLLPLLLTIVGCTDETDYSVPERDVAGDVDGMPWTAVGAYAEADFFDENKIVVHLYADEDFEPCTGASADGPTVFFTVPAEPGTHELSLTFDEQSMTATFYDGESNNVIASMGVIEIDTVSDDEIVGGLNIEAKDGYAVAGQFSAVRCGG